MAIETTSDLSSVVSSQIVDGAVTSAKIADNAVVAAKIASGSINSTHIGANAVVSGDIASGAVGSAALATGAVVSAAIASGAVGSAALADNAVVAAKIAAASVGTAKLDSGAATSGQLLTANGTGGATYTTVSSGGYVLISSNTVTASNSLTTVTFLNIPQTYSHLVLQAYISSSNTLTNGQIAVAISSTTDDPGNWVGTSAGFVGTQTYSILKMTDAATPTLSRINRTANTTEIGMCAWPDSACGAGFLIDILDYSATNRHKTINSTVYIMPSTSAVFFNGATVQQNTVPIKSMRITTNSSHGWPFQATSVFRLYGY